ncbi:heavy-metal-associated domain-containing protein [Psychroserpens sp. NJDZ02]|uniref:heavy-metal-associated domain-containing protein n=1 Tax=Psychroserpens sp. NJDZ02 TaxID=2570561 RepID=UPI0010A8F20C|nr:heavy-metal-associated domain-containing protein [Psychroserpens sp. NJDZ02]QCE42497.1 heavy-metal-associated domain-containing protein [Psychroserpens sp. NJDZ02]
MNTSIVVQNLKCGGCANSITTKLAEIENITDINVDVDSSLITFSHNNKVDAATVKDKLKILGYPSIDDDNNLMFKAKSFVSCATGKLSK